MSYISMLIAYFMTTSNDSNIKPEAWYDVYFDNLVQVEYGFFQFFLGLLILFVVLASLGGLVMFFGRNRLQVETAAFFTCGCMVPIVGIVFLPLFEYFTYFLATNMADAVGPVGIVNEGKFYISLALYLLVGIA